jgi:hypothetical protein
MIGQSKLGDIIRALIDEGSASIVCGTCSKLLLQDEKKIEVAGIVYCQKDAFAAAKALNPGLTDEKEFEKRAPLCPTKGLKELGVHVYMPNPIWN